MKTSGDAAQFFKKDAQLDKAMNETFIPLDLATFETMPKFLPGEITIYNVGYQICQDLHLRSPSDDFLQF
jgi:hypothetical protein